MINLSRIYPVEELLSKEHQLGLVQCGFVSCGEVERFALSKDGSGRDKHWARKLMPYIFDSSIKQAIDRGDLPFGYLEQRVSENGFPYLCFSFNRLRFTVSKTEGRYSMPRKSGFRVENSQLNRQLLLGTEEIGFIRPNRASFAQDVYGVLCYDYKGNELLHLGLGIPDESYERWLDYKTFEIPMVRPLESVEKIADEADPDLREDLRRKSKSS